LTGTLSKSPPAPCGRGSGGGGSCPETTSLPAHMCDRTIKARNSLKLSGRTLEVTSPTPQPPPAGGGGANCKYQTGRPETSRFHISCKKEALPDGSASFPLPPGSDKLLARQELRENRFKIADKPFTSRCCLVNIRSHRR